MGRYITNEIFIDAVERSEPLFEKGDSFGNDVARLMIYPSAETGISGRNRQLLLSKIKPNKNWHIEPKSPLTFISSCVCCGHNTSISMSRSALLKKNKLFYVCHDPKFNHISVEYKGSKYSLRIKDMVAYLGIEDNTYCSTCYSKLLSNLENKILDYIYCDKFKYWEEYYQSDKRNIRNPFEDFVSCFSIDNNNQLYCICDKISGLYFYKDGTSKTEEEVRKLERIALEKRQAVISNKKKKQCVITSNSIDSINSDNETLFTNTDIFIQKYCTATKLSATIADLEIILEERNVDERQLRASLSGMLYKNFIKTIYWKSLVLRRKFMDNLCCTNCGNKNRLEVHHLTYEHHGDERHHLEDLVTLCHSCHENIHRLNDIIRPR